VALIEVPLITTTPVAAAPPIVTESPARKPVPVSVTAVPPPTTPIFGAMPVTVGGGGTRAVAGVTARAS